MKMFRIFSTAAVLILAVWLTGCQSEVSIQRVDSRDRIDYGIPQSVLGLRPESVNFLANHLLTGAYDSNRPDLIARIEKIIGKEVRAESLAILADVALNQGLRCADPDLSARYFLTALGMGYSYLTAADRRGAEPFNPERIGVMRIYNAALVEFLGYLQTRNLLLHSEFEFDMLGGQRIAFRAPKFYLGETGVRLGAIELCANYRPLNLTHSSYQFGLGATAMIQPENLNSTEVSHRFYPDLVMPATALITFQRTDETMTNFSARLIFYNTRHFESVALPDGAKLPLELDFSTPLAYMSRKPLPLNFLNYMLRADQSAAMEGLYLMEPVRSDRIPVVLVHGLMSNTRTWLQLLNTLQSDPELRRHYQFWGFTYSSGLPVLYSAKLLRDSLDRMRDDLKKRGLDDRMFNRMVVVGHSMGGLLGKTLVTRSEDKISENILGVSLDMATAGATPAQQEFLRGIMIFEPRPYVRRVVFMAVPHRGSQLARSLVGRLGVSLIRLPINLVKDARGGLRYLFRASGNELELRTGIDNLDPSDKMLRTLAELPFAPDVPVHSIIGNEKQSGVPGGSDGVVPYESSHLDGVKSELVVQSGHSVHKHPLAIQELRRILLEHLRQYPDLKIGTGILTKPVIPLDPDLKPVRNQP